MALEFLYRREPLAKADPARIALFPGAWNPPTRAHVAIAGAARTQADEVIWVLPRAFPHKEFGGATFDARRRMLEQLARAEGFSAAVSEGGLYASIACEAREFFGPETAIQLVCGRDAAERIAAWNYGTPGFFDEMIREYHMLVAARQGEYEPAAQHSGRIHKLVMDAHWDEVSSSEVRRRIAGGEDWQSIVPPPIAAMVENIYRSGPL